MFRYQKADLTESSPDGPVSRPACRVFSSRPIDSLWRNLLERAGLQLMDRGGGARPSLVVVFAGFTSPVAEMGLATAPVILVTNDGTAVLADPGGQLYVTRASCAELIEHKRHTEPGYQSQQRLRRCRHRKTREALHQSRGDGGQRHPVRNPPPPHVRHCRPSQQRQQRGIHRQARP